MKKIVITNRNRDGAKLWLEHIEDNIYKICTDKDYILEYATVSYTELDESAEDYDTILKMPDGNTIKIINYTFDPSGGPYMALGDIYEGYAIRRIFNIENCTDTFFKMDKVENYPIATITETEITGGPYVDLGLPSGKKWASCNIGAEKPCDCGQYFMWGSTEDNSNTDCSESNMPFGSNPPTVLSTDNDVVYQRTNGAAHMPTQTDIQELLDGTTSTWCQCTVLGDDHTTHTVNGRLFTSKTNSNNIFIPAAGHRSGSSFYRQGSRCYLWSSSLYESSPYLAWYLYFNSGDTYVYRSNRYSGLSVRGVI